MFIHAVTLILLTVLDFFILSLLKYNELNPKLRYIELFVQGWRYWLPVAITGLLASIWVKINYANYYK